MVETDIGFLGGAIEAGIKASQNVDYGPVQDPHLQFIFDTTDIAQYAQNVDLCPKGCFLWGMHKWEAPTFLVAP